jgi:2,4-dienoyl-CoA reductase-like NADH-dependent reductase (Old Yellow Enzyme family)
MAEPVEGVPAKEPVQLFTPFTVRGLTFKNRMIMPPMDTFACDAGERLLKGERGILF